MRLINLKLGDVLWGSREYEGKDYGIGYNDAPFIVIKPDGDAVYTVVGKDIPTENIIFYEDIKDLNDLFKKLEVDEDIASYIIQEYKLEQLEFDKVELICKEFNKILKKKKNTIALKVQYKKYYFDLSEIDLVRYEFFYRFEQVLTTLKSYWVENNENVKKLLDENEKEIVKAESSKNYVEPTTYYIDAFSDTNFNSVRNPLRTYNISRKNNVGSSKVRTRYVEK